VVLINEAMKRQLWPNEDPVGKRVSNDGGQHWAQIIGVVGDVREFGLDHPPVPEVYAPQKLNPAPGVVLVRTAAEPTRLAKALTAAIHEIDPQTAAEVQYLEKLVSDVMPKGRYWLDAARYADTNGYLEMPGGRTATSAEMHWYYANSPSDVVPTGRGDESAIHSVWAEDTARLGKPD
jgi:hypothetical protein